MSERYDIKQLPDYVVDKEFLCLQCLANETNGKIFITNNYCHSCLRWLRNPGPEYKEKGPMQLSMLVTIANIFSINFGIDVLTTLIDEFDWGTILLKEKLEESILLIKECLAVEYNSLEELEKELIKHIYEKCLEDRNLEIITKYYVDLYNTTCSSGEENLKLIECISVRNLFGYHSYNFTMSKKPLSVIIGTNGLGKTTIFNILKAILVEGNSLYESYQKLKYILSIPFDEFKVVFRDGTKIELFQIISEDNKKHLLFNLDDNNEGKFCEDEKLEKIFGDFKDIADFSDFADVVSKDDFFELMLFSCGMDGIYEAIREKFPKIQVLKERFLFIETKRITLDKLCDEIALFEMNDENEDKFNKLFEAFSNLYYKDDPSLKKLELTKNNKLIVKTSGNKEIDTNCLSSGEKGALQILYDVIFNSVKNSIILIDEPEISLHIAWQQQIAESISKIANERKGSQIIIATHSPFMASANADSIVEAELV